MKDFFNKRRYKRLKGILLIIIVTMLVVFSALYLNNRGAKMMENDYENAKKLYEKGDAESILEAKKIFEDLGSYSESDLYREKIEYLFTLDKIKNDYSEIKGEVNDLKKLDVLEDILKRIDKLIETSIGEDVLCDKAKSLRTEIAYTTAKMMYENKQYEVSMMLFQDIKEYKNSEYYLAQITLQLYPKAQESLHIRAESLFDSGKYQDALDIYNELGDYKNSKEQSVICKRKILASSVSAGIRATSYISKDKTIKNTKEATQKFDNIQMDYTPLSISAKGLITLVLDETGRVHMYGSSLSNTSNYFEKLTDIVQIATGEQYAVALDSSGKVYAFGHNGDGQCDVEKQWDKINIKEVSCGWRTTVGLDYKGNILIEGYRKNRYLSAISQPDSGWNNIIHISTAGGGQNAKGDGHLVGLRKDGTVIAIGDNDYGQCNTDEWKKVIKISAGDIHTVGLRSDGKVYITNRDKGYELKSFPEDIIDISAGLGYTIYVGKSGKAYTDDNPYTGQGQVDGIEDWDILVY